MSDRALPLDGWRVAVTRAAHQAGDLVERLEAAGASALRYPTIALAPPGDATALDAALRRAAGYDWLLVTSANTAQVLADRLAALGLTPDALSGPRLAAVGPATAVAVAETLGLTVDAVAPDGAAAGLAAALGPLNGRTVLLPQSALAGDDLAAALRRQGATVDAPTVYRIVVGSGGDDLPGALRRGEVDAVTFTSPSTVDFIVQRLAVEAGLAADALRGPLLACIGATTARALLAHGLRPGLAAQPSTAQGLVDSLAREATLGSRIAQILRIGRDQEFDFRQDLQDEQDWWKLNAGANNPVNPVNSV